MCTEFIDDGTTEKGEDDVGDGVDAVEEVKFDGIVVIWLGGGHVVFELLVEGCGDVKAVEIKEHERTEWKIYDKHDC